MTVILIAGRAGKQEIELTMYLVKLKDISIASPCKDNHNATGWIKLQSKSALYISVVYHMDQEVFSILFGLYSKSTAIVYGE